jgi:hypothetical protein
LACCSWTETAGQHQLHLQHAASNSSTALLYSSITVYGGSTIVHHVQNCASAPAAEAPSLGGLQASAAAVPTARCTSVHVPPGQQQVQELDTQAAIQGSSTEGWVAGSSAAQLSMEDMVATGPPAVKKKHNSVSSSSSAGQAGGSMQQSKAS